jgi:geranylgeranyl diphosphate synthase, type II
MHSPDELRDEVERFLAGLELSHELGQLDKVVRYALAGGGKRIRPVLCLATTEAAGGDPRRALPAAAALELVHSFSLVHDDLPALDDDEQRRGRPSVHVRFGEAQAILAGDALLNEAFSLALGYEQPHVGRELTLATSGMIGGQYLDIDGGREDQFELNRLKTARLFEASIGCGLWVAQVPAARQQDWRGFGAEFGVLYQVVDDLLDGDGLVRERGREATLELATGREAVARAKLDTIGADTSVLTGLVDELAARVQQSSV